MIIASARNFRKLFALLSIIFSLTITASAIAGVTGKLKGKVIDKETGEPVVNANIVEKETQMWGGSTNFDGEFIILNIPPGIYDAVITCLGFHEVVVLEIPIHSDQTSEQNIELTPEALKRPEVKIIAERPRVIVSQTDATTRYTKQKVENLRPEGMATLLKATTGVIEDEEGKYHVRGSRAGEVAILVDGVDLRDPMVDTNVEVQLGAENVEEVSILKGGYSAEYGRAMGGIVQLTTRKGSIINYSGRFEYQTDRIIDTYSFDTDRGEFSFGGPVPFTRDWLGKPVTFHFSSIGKLSNTYTPFDIQRPANDYLGLGFDVPERQQNTYQSSLKLGYPLSDTKQLDFSFRHTYSQWDIYPRGEGGVSGNYGYRYKYNLENRPWAFNQRLSGTMTFTNTLSQNTYYELRLLVFQTHSKVQPGGKNPGEFTLQDDIEDNFAFAFDVNNNGKLDSDEYLDTDGDGFMDGFVDANQNGIFDGGGEGYEDLNFNGRWDRGEDWVDLNGNGIYDAAEPWIDVGNPLTGENNLGVFDLWDTYSDLNGNGRWDPAEPQLPEHDWNNNGLWDGERFIDANGNGRYDPLEEWDDLNGNFLWDEGEPFIDLNNNGVFDYSEGYDDKNSNGTIDRHDLIEDANDDRNEPFIDGDRFWDTGEPYIDEPDPITGEYNGRWDPGELFFDLPSSSNPQTGAGLLFPGVEMTLNGRYDGPNFLFDEYELFTRPASWSFGSDPSRPIWYTFDEEARGTDWPADIFQYIPGKSTWINRTLHDKHAPEFDFPNRRPDIDKEWWIDYNNNGRWNSEDFFLNPGVWDPNSLWQDRVSTEYTVKFDITSQATSHHEMKSGVEVKYRVLEMQSISQPDLPYTGEAVLPEGSPWPDRGGTRDFYNYKPIEGALYIQDKMEFEGLVVRAGLRYDFIRHDRDMVDEFRDRLERDEPGAILANRGTSRISPRLGISHPISRMSKLFFNYGHFYQAPSFQYFYRSATANFEVNSTIGNPNLEYEKTVQYELGIETQISDYVLLTLSGYYKDQYDLISTDDERWKNMTLDRYVNLDYGRMRGFEFEIDKELSDHYSLTFNYDFSYAYGKASDQLANRTDRLEGIPYNWDEHPLNWDETHKLNSYLTIYYLQGENPQLFGLVFPDDWRLTLQWEFGSGLPYTPSLYLVGEDNQNLVLPNSSRLPWHELSTLKFEKYYTLNPARRSRLLFGFTVTNLFNKRNISAVYTQTGSPTESQNPLDPAYNPFDNRDDYDANPRNYSAGRNVLFRVGMTF